uniref:Arf-GAP domain-containing protein n=1 Tax=Glossina brevipalpis TaxID=37001 RepID=A0A1A9X5T7_9MUSC
MAVVRKKQDDKYLEALRELITTGGGNRQCFDCGQKGPTYVNMTIGSFVCTRCSGVLRGLTPPQRVKSISMATFTQEEIDFLKTHGNDICSKTWLGLWDPKRVVHQDQRELMIDKYERKRYYLEPASPLKSLTNHATNLKTTTASAGVFAAVSTNKNCTTQSNNNSKNNNSNSNNENNKNRNNNYNQNNNLTQLTPPNTQCNGLRKNTLTQKMTTTTKTTTTTAISRPQHTTLLQNGIKETDAFGSGCSAATISDTSSSGISNGFSGETDFVADFGTANIFDATTVYSPEISPSNGYAKIQTLKPARQPLNNEVHQKNRAQISAVSLPNGHIKHENENGQFLGNANTENFADFEHAPIYNAAESQHNFVENVNYKFVRKYAIRKKSVTETPARNNQFSDESESRAKQKSLSLANMELKDCQSRFDNPFDYFDAIVNLNNADNQFKGPREYIKSEQATNSNQLRTNNHQEIVNVASKGKQFNFNNDFQETQATKEMKSFQNVYNSTWITWPTDNEISTNHQRFSFNNINYSQQPQQQQYNHNTALPLSSNNSDGFSSDNNHQMQQVRTTQAQAIATVSSPSSSLTSMATTCSFETLPSSTSSASSMIYHKLSFTNPFRVHLLNNNNNGRYCDSSSSGFVNSKETDNNVLSRSNPNLTSSSTLRNCDSNFNSNSNYENNSNASNDQKRPNETTTITSETQSVFTRCYRPDNFSTTSSIKANNTNPAINSIEIVPCYRYDPDNDNDVNDATNTSSPIQNPNTNNFCPSNYLFSNLNKNVDYNFYSSNTSNSCCLPMPSGFSNNKFMNSTRDCNNSNQNVSNNNNSIRNNNNNNNCNNKNNYNNNNNNNNNHNNHNNSQSSPSEDRYAALKDLDEQLRESKAIAAQAISILDNSFGNPSNSNQVNPFATQLAQENQQQSQPANPFRNTTHSAAQLFGQMTLIPTLATNNGQKPQANASFFNYTSNGFNTGVVNGTNGCGFGFGTLQQEIALTGLGFTDNTFNNPFAATGTLNANNPFL